MLTAVKQGHGPRDNLKAWLYQTAHHLVIDYYRRQKHRNHLALSDDLIDASDDPVRSAEGHLSAKRVRAALHCLTLEQQQVIVLKYLEGLSNAEVSDITGKPVGAVKSLQHRALVALRSELTRRPGGRPTHTGRGSGWPPLTVQQHQQLGAEAALPGSFTRRREQN